MPKAATTFPVNVQLPYIWAHNPFIVVGALHQTHPHCHPFAQRSLHSLSLTATHYAFSQISYLSSFRAASPTSVLVAYHKFIAILSTPPQVESHLRAPTFPLLAVGGPEGLSSRPQRRLGPNIQPSSITLTSTPARSDLPSMRQGNISQTQPYDRPSRSKSSPFCKMAPYLRQQIIVRVGHLHWTNGRGGMLSLPSAALSAEAMDGSECEVRVFKSGCERVHRKWWGWCVAAAAAIYVGEVKPLGWLPHSAAGGGARFRTTLMLSKAALLAVCLERWSGIWILCGCLQIWESAKSQRRDRKRRNRLGHTGLIRALFTDKGTSTALHSGCGYF